MKKQNNGPITAVLFGAGDRGMTVYGNYALKNKKKLKFVAVAEPIETRREKFAKLHDIPPNRCYKSWEDIITEKKLADTAFICMQDQMHVDPAIQALEKGYDVLLEKPMAHTLEGCVKIVEKVEETGRILGIGHVLRYTKFFSTIYDTIQKGLLGIIVNISHRENVSWYHMAHSFVRGNWRNVETSSPMILAKCCHDLDLLYWMVGSLPKKISSFGNLLHFKPENAPEGAPKYCLDGCPVSDTCNYYAPRIYVDIVPIIQIVEKSDNKLYKFFINLRKKHKITLIALSKLIHSLKGLRYWKDWPVNALYADQPEDYSDEGKKEILKTSPYGRCVYRCDNDVVDHQVVNIEFENGATATLTMHGFSEREGRTLRIDGTKATLIGEFHGSGEKITFYDHYLGTEEVLYSKKLSLGNGHGGGDFLLIEAFIESLKDKNKRQPLTNARASLESHLMAFASEESRTKNVIVDMEEFRKKAESN